MAHCEAYLSGGGGAIRRGAASHGVQVDGRGQRAAVQGCGGRPDPRPELVATGEGIAGAGVCEGHKWALDGGRAAAGSARIQEEEMAYQGNATFKASGSLNKTESLGES